MPKTLSAKFYSEMKERLQEKKVLKDIKIFVMRRNKKRNVINVNVIKIPQKMKN